MRTKPRAGGPRRPSPSVAELGLEPTQGHSAWEPMRGTRSIVLNDSFAYCAGRPDCAGRPELGGPLRRCPRHRFTTAFAIWAFPDAQAGQRRMAISVTIFPETPAARLAIDENGYGPDHPTVANLALLLRATNRPSEAEPLYRRALAISENDEKPAQPPPGQPHPPF
jgi:hypothetical protein